MEDVLIATTLGEVRVRHAGSGPAILFWPSLLMTGDMWAAQAAHFGDRHRVVDLLDGVAHLAALEDPPLVNALVTDFISALN